MPPKTEKTFDCIAFKREVQAAHYERTKHMTDDQWLADLKQRAAEGPLGDWWQRIGSESDDASVRAAEETPPE